MSVLLIFEIQETNGALFLKAHFFSYASLFGFVTVIVPLTTIYASLKLHNYDCNIDVLNLICLLGLYLSSNYLTDHNFYPFFSNKSTYFIRRCT